MGPEITIFRKEFGMSDYIDLGNGNELEKAIKVLAIPEHIPTGQNCKYLEMKEKREDEIYEQNLNVQDS
jgi:hypothetical protein